MNRVVGVTVLMAVAVAVLLAGCARATASLRTSDFTMWISPNGTDSNPGTAALPKQTLKNAVDSLTPEQFVIECYPGLYVFQETAIVANRPEIVIQPVPPDAVVAFGANGTAPGILATVNVSSVSVFGIQFVIPSNDNNFLAINVSTKASVNLSDNRFMDIPYGVSVSFAAAGSSISENEFQSTRTGIRVVAEQTQLLRNSLIYHDALDECAFVLSGNNNTISGSTIARTNFGLCVERDDVAKHGFAGNRLEGNIASNTYGPAFNISATSGPNVFNNNEVYFASMCSAPLLVIGSQVSDFVVANSSFGANSASKFLVEIEAGASSLEFIEDRFVLAMNGVHITGPLKNSTLVSSCFGELSGNLIVCDSGDAATCIKAADNSPCPE